MKRTIASLLTAALIATSALSAHAEDAAPSSIDAQIERYIMTHPEVILKSLKKYKGRDRITPQHAEMLKGTGSSPVYGNPAGDIVIYEFFDYHCGYCKRFYNVLSTLAEEDKGLKIVFKELPILSEDSEVAARAALAVNFIDPKKYFGFHSALMKTTGAFTVDKIKDLAKQAGVDDKKLLEMMRSQKVTSELGSQQVLAEEMDISGTPLIIVGDQMIAGAIDHDQLKAKIAAIRQRSGGAN